MSLQMLKTLVQEHIESINCSDPQLGRVLSEY